MSNPTLPQLSRERAIEIATAAWRAGGNTAPLPAVCVLAVRGYWEKSMGNPSRNDVGIFDDAFFLITPDGFYPERANTDPSKVGWNPGVGKPFFMLDPGVWYFYPGPHKGVTPAFRQADDAAVAKRLGIGNEGKFTGVRMWGWEDSRNYKETGHQQVNIHPGGQENTSSWACQTLPAGRAKAWLQRGWDELKKHKMKTLPYILVKGPVN